MITSVSNRGRLPFDDDAEIIIVSADSCTLRLGFPDRCTSAPILVGSTAGIFADGAQAYDDNKVLVGEESFRFSRFCTAGSNWSEPNAREWNIRCPVHHSPGGGCVNDWQYMEKVWRSAFCNELRVGDDLEEYPLLLSEHPLTTKAERARTARRREKRGKRGEIAGKAQDSLHPSHTL